MKDKDIVYIGIIGFLAYLLFKKEPSQAVLKTTNSNANPVGNATNGGLNLPSNMDLPNLTPTPANGLPTEVALNNSYIQPLVKDNNEPEQVFGNYNLPTPYIGGSIVNPNPIDVVLPTTSSNPVIETLSSSPVAETVTSPVSTTTVSGVNTVETSGSVGANPTPISTGASAVSEPVFPVKVKAEIITEEPSLVALPKTQDIEYALSQCGNSFSIPNNDKEGSYTNYWYDGKDFYTQTTSPLVKTIPVKINSQLYLEGCKKYQLFQFKAISKV
jgi:hypothetical protein